MKENKKTVDKFLYLLPFLIFFTGSFIFFGFFADYVEYYQEKLSLFVFSSDYLKSSLSQPGSLLAYFGRFLSTFYYYPVAGAIIISLTICLIMFMISKIISFLTGKPSILLPLLFGTAFFIMHTNYQYLLYNSLGVLFQIILFYLAIRYLKGFLPVVIFPFWYFITGGFAWIFALMYTLYLVVKSIKKEWPKIVSLFALSFIFIYFLKEFFLFQSFKTLMIFPFSDENTGTQFRFYIPIICFIIFLPLVVKWKISVPVRIRQKDPFKIIVLSLVSLILVSAPGLLRFDRANKEYFHAEKLFSQGRFSEVTRYISNHPSTNRLTIYLNNVALSETGRLTDQLFHFPQSPDGQSLFLKWEMIGEVLRRGAYFYYTTGMINEAQRWAFENMVMKGITAEDLRMLIKTEMINGNYKVASKYISMLKKTIYYRNEARDFERLLSDEKSIESDSELGVRRREKIEHDFFSITDNPYVNVDMAFSADSLNRKLFEYKMAFLMLNEDYAGIASGLARLESLGYTKIPIHLQEVALVCKMSGSALPEFVSLKIDPQIETRFNQFLQMFGSYGNNLKKAQPYLRQKFGNTFWYYGFYH
jgi:hypothetical protein